MKNLTVTRKLEFDAGHRLIGHESKCRHLHGHRYVAEITVSSMELDTCGRVIDFSKIKEVVGGWIDQYWDHNMILNELDPLLSLDANQGAPYNIFNGKHPFVMFDDRTYADVPGCNPTAENMVKFLFDTAVTLLRPYHIQVDKIRLYETPNCWADYERPEPIQIDYQQPSD